MSERNEQNWILHQTENLEAILPGIIQKPWGHEKIIAKTDEYVVKEIYVKPNSRLSLQYHEKKIETMMLVSGVGYLQITGYMDGPLTLLRPICIYPYDIHRLYTKDKDCLIVEVSSTELDDVVRVEDDYGR